MSIKNTEVQIVLVGEPKQIDKIVTTGDNDRFTFNKEGLMVVACKDKNVIDDITGDILMIQIAEGEIMGVWNSDMVITDELDAITKDIALSITK